MSATVRTRGFSFSGLDKVTSSKTRQHSLQSSGGVALTNVQILQVVAVVEDPVCI